MKGVKNMKIVVRESYIKDKRILHFIEKLKKLEFEARRRQEIFFAMKLKNLKKCKKIVGGR